MADRVNPVLAVLLPPAVHLDRDGQRRVSRRGMDGRRRLRHRAPAGRGAVAGTAGRIRAARSRAAEHRPHHRGARGRPLHDRDRSAAREGRLAGHGPSTAPTTEGGTTMKRLLAIAAIAAVCALAALAALSGSARATYAGATNGRIAFGINVNGNVDVYTVLP